MKKRFLPFVNRRFVQSAGAAGDFTASTHLSFLLKAEEVWADGKLKDDNMAHVDAILAQLGAQTARFPELDNPNKDNTVTITWLKQCASETTDLDRSTDICTIEGVEFETDSQEHAFDLGFKDSFSVDEEKIRTGTYEMEEQVAFGLLRADKKLSERWCKEYLLAVKAAAGPNIPAINGDALPMTWNSGDGATDIPASLYDVKMVSRLVMMQQLNQVASGFYINRGSLFTAWLDAGYDTGNTDGKGDGARKAAVNMTFDMWNFSKAALTEDMFLVSNSALAVKTYTRYTDTPVYKAGNINQWRYRMASKILPGVYYDVIHQLTCVNGHDVHTFQVMSVGGIFLNPFSCPQTVTIDDVETSVEATGVYSFNKTA
jgi:hypothetical protein